MPTHNDLLRRIQLMEEELRILRPKIDTLHTLSVVYSPKYKDFLGNKIVGCVLKEFKLRKEDLFSQSRVRGICDARFIAFSLLYKNSVSKSEIGRMFNKNHATVLNGIRQAEYFYLNNSEFQTYYDNIESNIKKF